MRIVFTNTKGGTGKTTSAIFLATALTEHGSVELWDTDPQRSTYEWSQLAAKNGTPLPFAVDAGHPGELASQRKSSDFVLIDTGPADIRGIDFALKNADVAIITSAPAPLDLARVWSTEEVTSQKVASYVLLTQVNPRTRAYRAALTALEEHGVGHFETYIPARESFRRAYGTCPSGDLLGYREAAQELLEVRQ